MRLNTIFRYLFLAVFFFGGINVATAGGGNDKEFNPGETALHHIADAHTYHVWGDFYLPLPGVFLYAPNDGGLTVLPSAGSFDIGKGGNGSKAIDRYVLMHGVIKRIKDKSFPMGEQTISWDSHGAGHDAHGHDHSGHNHDHHGHDHDHHGHDHSGHNHDHGKKDKKAAAGHAEQIMFNGKAYDLEDRTTWDGELAGGGVTSYYDFSITKNVFTMLFVALLLGFLFISAARAYKTRDGQAPSGLQGFLEPLFLFIQDEVAKPMIGEEKYLKFMPYLMSAFFFILGLNLVGQIPFFPGSGNASGAISVTIGLALFTFIVTTINGNKHYWEHILWMPGVPAWVKTIITPVEIMGMFLKPIVLFIRLFANISAGHIVIVAFVGLIFVLGESGKNLMGAGFGAIAAVLLTTFMMALELLVAFLQAYIFTILSASYIGAAVEEHHHDDDHH